MPPLRGRPDALAPLLCQSVGVGRTVLIVDDHAGFRSAARAFLDPDLPQEMLPERWPRTRAHQVFVERHAEWQGPAQAYFGSLERLVGAPADRAA